MARDQPEPAMQLMSAARTQREVLFARAFSSEQERLDRSRSQAEAALGVDRFANAWASGGRLTIDAAIALALSVVEARAAV